MNECYQNIKVINIEKNSIKQTKNSIQDNYLSTIFSDKYLDQKEIEEINSKYPSNISKEFIEELNFLYI